MSLLKIHISVFLFGLTGLFAKFLDLSAFMITFGRVFFASIAILLILLFRKKKLALESSKDYLILVFLGVVLAFHWFAFFESIQLSTVAIGLLTFSTFPIFTTFLEPVFFDERIQARDIVFALIAFFGIALVIPKYEFGNNLFQGALWGVASGFSFAFLQILNRKYVKKYSSLTITFYQVAVASLVLLPFVLSEAGACSMQEILLLALLGVLFTAIAHSLFIEGLEQVKVQVASIIASLEPVYGIIFAAWLLNEIPSLRTLIGGVIILGLAFYLTLRSSKDF